MNIRHYAKDLSAWYRKHRVFFEGHAPERAAELDTHAKRLETIVEQADDEDVAVCFLGKAGVGKSTLINAVVAGTEMLLPQGGVGPLTAQATSVRFAAEPYFKAVYQPVRQLHRLLFGLEKQYEAVLARQGKQAAGSADDLEVLVDDAETLSETTDAVTDDESELFVQYRNQASLMVTGMAYNADVAVPYLLDCLREVLHRHPRWGSAAATAEDVARVEALRAYVGRAKDNGPVTRTRAVDENRFRAELRENACGALAPLIETLEVGWDAEFLRDGLVVVDLPGVGIASDAHRKVTEQWIRGKARAIVLVVDKSGLDEASADLLSKSGFLSRLLHSADDPLADPATLIIAAVKLDDPASDAWRDERQRSPSTARRWPDHFEQQCERMVQLVRGQVATELQRLATEGVAQLRDDREALMKRVIDSLEIYPVCAPEYRKLIAHDEEDRPRLTHEAESGIPAFRAALCGVATRRRQLIATRAQEIAVTFHGRLAAIAQIVKSKWEDEELSTAALEQLAKDLEKLIRPLRRELDARNGAYREFLRATLPQQIATLVERGGNTAGDEMRKYLAGLGEAHWAQLKATVRRGGRFIGKRHIDLPVTFAQSFEDPIAVIWAKEILRSLRVRTKELAADQVRLVEEIVVWAESQGTRIQARLIEALRDQIRAETKDLTFIGKEAIDELRARVRECLHPGIEEAVRKRCQTFFRREEWGQGTRRRILDFLHTLVPEVVEAAKKPAMDILLENFKNVRREIERTFRNIPDPLEHAKKTILESHKERETRRSTRLRAEVLGAVKAVLASAPTSLPTGNVPGTLVAVA